MIVGRAGLLLAAALPAAAHAVAALAPPPATPLAPRSAAAHRSLPLDIADVADMLRIAGDSAQIVSSDHFVVVTTGERDVARRVVDGIQPVYAAVERFAAATNTGGARPTAKLPVFLFATYDEFDRHRAARRAPDEGLLGFHDEDTGRTVLFNLSTTATRNGPLSAAGPLAAHDELDSLAPAERARRIEALLLHVARHEAAHQVLRALGVLPPRESAPPWLVEGLAQAFETPADSATCAGVAVNAVRLAQLRRTYGRRCDDLPDLSRVLFSGEWWSEQGGAAYPLAWAIHHYLVSTRPERYGAWIRGFSGHRLARDAALERTWFEAHFGPVDAAWTRDFVGFINALADPSTDADAVSRPARQPP